MDHRSTRRAFFATGGAVLGAGVATTVGAATLARPDAEARPVDRSADREAIRALQFAFASAIERQAWDEAAALFDERGSLEIGEVRANGRVGIVEALQARHAGDAPLHAAYRARPTRDEYAIAFREGRAIASLAVDVRIHVPLKDDCTAASMARLQGNLADIRWESGRLEATCIGSAHGWKISALRYVQA